MCDDFTATEEQAALARRGLSRREFAAFGAAGMLAACTAAPGTAEAAATGLRETRVIIPTPDGRADALFIHPAKGRHPGVLLWPDIAGLRDAYALLARRLAGAGFAVLAVNHYYRSAPAPILKSMAEWRTPEGQARLKPMIAALSPAGTMRDAATFVGWLDRQASVDPARGIGTQGYCMGGPFAVRTAAALPGRVRAVASFHGANLVNDTPDSPHRLLTQTRASYLFAIARNDDARAPGDKDTLRAAATAAGRPAEIEVYPADHGWCTPDAPVYDQPAADRAWDRLLALYRGL